MLPLHHDPGRPHSGVCVCIAPSYRSPPSPSRLTTVRESGRPDSNRRSQAPRACGLARLSHALFGPGRRPRGTASTAPVAKGKGPVFTTPGLETPRGGFTIGRVSTALGIQRTRTRRTTAGPLGGSGRSGVVSDIRRSSQSRPLWTISGRFDRSRRLMARGPVGRHRRVLYQMDAGPDRDVRAGSGFFSKSPGAVGHSLISMRVR